MHLFQVRTQRLARAVVLRPVGVGATNLDHNGGVALDAKAVGHLLPRVLMDVVATLEHLDAFASDGLAIDLAANVRPLGLVRLAVPTVLVVHEAAANVTVAYVVELFWVGHVFDRAG